MISIMMRSAPLLMSTRHKAAKQPYITCMPWQPLSMLPILSVLWGQGSCKIHKGSWRMMACLKTHCICWHRFCRCTHCSSGAAGAVPAKGRPATTWGHDSPLTAEPLPGWECTSSILHMHLTQQHLVVMHASAGSSAAASAIWLDNHSLQQIARLALPTNICHAWTDFGLSKAIVSTTCGSVFTFSVHPQVQSCCHCLLHAQ